MRFRCVEKNGESDDKMETRNRERREKEKRGKSRREKRRSRLQRERRVVKERKGRESGDGVTSYHNAEK